MTAENAEPVEISTRFRPGEWTEASLTALTASYQEKIVAMGAASEDIATSIVRGMDGSVAVSVSWDPGAQDSVPAGDAAGSPAGRDAVEGNPEIARGFGEDIPPGDITEDAKGLGAVLGDADRSALDDPPVKAGTPGQADTDEAPTTFTRHTDEEGEPYLEDTDDTGQGPRE